MLNDLSFLEAGQDWIPNTEKDRLALYELNHSLYENEHLEVLDMLLKVVYPEQEVNETVKRVFINLYRSVSKLWADLLFSESPTISNVTDETTEDYLNALIKATKLWKTARKVAIDVSRYGNGLFKIRNRNGKVVIEAVTPRLWFPVVNPDNINEILMHVIAYTFVENKVHYLKAEIHEIGRITHKLFIVDKDAGKIKEEIDLKTLARYATLEPVEETKVDDFLIVPVSNSADSEDPFGEDDYTDINPIISQIELHLSKLGKDLEEQGNLKYGPGTAVDENGHVERGSYIVMLGGANKQDPPGVVTWTVQFEAVKEYISQLMFFFYMVGEISPVMFDPNKTVASDLSGISLKRLMQRMISKAGRLAEDFDETIKRVFAIAAQLEGKELKEFEIDWQDGIADDIAERVETAQKAGVQQTMSQKTAIAFVQKLEGKPLEDELAEISEEQKSKTVLPLSDLYPEEENDEENQNDNEE